MISKHILKKLNEASEEEIQNEKELIMSFAPYNRKEQSVVTYIAKKYKGFLRAEEVADILGVAASTVYRNQEFCPVRELDVESNRKYFLPHSVVILAREIGIRLYLKKIRRCHPKTFFKNVTQSVNE